MRRRARSRVAHFCSAEGQAIFRRVFLHPLHERAPSRQGKRPECGKYYLPLSLFRKLRFD
jgi:hypothetical protein